MKKINWKHIAKCLRSKKWGQYRYAKTKGGWVFEQYCRTPYTSEPTWHERLVISRNCHPDYYVGTGYEPDDLVYVDSPSEHSVIKEINLRRWQEITLWVKKKRESKRYSKRKWKYIP